MRRFAVALGGALWVGLAAPALGAPVCRVQTLSIQGQSVKATFCVTNAVHESSGAGIVARISLSENLVGPGGSLDRTTTKDVLLAGGSGRLSDDLPLRELGIDRMLHVTFVYSNGGVRPESALLIPGAVPVL
ncbi:hypothetical protein EPN44_06890 [bacterium]|nr:MAG: hypothetical protein EPN44_06890 [bacterium]